MKKTKMIFASMVLMLGLMATPYQAFAGEEEDEETTPDGSCPECYEEDEYTWYEQAAIWAYINLHPR